MKFHIVGMKEPDYVMMIRTTYGTLGEFGEEKKTLHGQWSQACNNIQVPRSCLQPLYCYQDVIDNQNSYIMHLLSMEETWMTMHWPNRVFCFLLAITMVNVQNVATYFLNKPKMESLQSR